MASKRKILTETPSCLKFFKRFLDDYSYPLKPYWLMRSLDSKITIEDNIPMSQMDTIKTSGARLQAEFSDPSFVLDGASPL